MSILKRSLAIGSSAALVAAGLGLVASPAYAVGEVSIKPQSGTSYSVFNTDEFVVTTTVVTASVSATTLSYAITDTDGGKWYVKVGDITNTTGATADDAFEFSAKDEYGANIVLDITSGANANNVSLTAIADGSTAGFTGHTEADEAFGEFLVDFGALGAETVFISGIASAGASNTLTLSPYEGTVTAETNTKAGGIQLLDGVENIVGNSDEYDFGDGGATATVQAWIDLDADIDDVEAAYASAAQTITWVDPKATAVIPTAERFVQRSGTIRLNDVTANGNIAATIQFIPEVNTDQIDITKWEYKIAESDGTAVVAAHTLATGDLVGKLGDLTTRTGPKLHAVLDNAGSNFTLDVTKDYVISVANTDASAVWYAGAAYVPAANAGVVDQIEATVTTAAGNHLQTDADDLTVQLRSGSGAFTYTAQTKTADAVDAEVPSIQVLAVVTAGSYMSTGGSLAVSGATSSLTAAGTALIVTGFTDADGQWDVTVTSSAVTGESYTIEFYVLDGATDKWTKVKNVTGSTNATYVATYEAGTATTLTPDATVLSGESVTASFTVTDQFGVGTNLRGTKAVSVELKSANGTSLDEDAVVAADGSVSFTFDNYVTAGSADVLTASTYTGAVGSAAIGGALTKTVSLYNAPAATAVQVPATLTTNVTYGDFVADGAKATAAKPAPASGDLLLLTGTVVDENGAGIPAAVVTIAADGFQFQQVGSTKYYQDEITVSASAAGVYNVNMWTHVASSTGVKVTSTTADGKTATTLVKSYLPASNVNGNNLVFKLNMPETIVMNTTYAVVAELTDKWGNPIQTVNRTSGGVTYSGVTIQGVGSVQINSSDTATVKNFGKDGKTTVFVRSVKDIAGPGSVTATLGAANYKATSAASDTALNVDEIALDVATTVFDETSFANEISESVEVLETAQIGRAHV